MVRGDDDPAGASTKAFDSEFAFYGPVGFDIGQLWANLLMAAARSATLGDADNLAWRLEQPVVVWEAFEETLRAHWPQRVDAAVFTDRFLDRFLDRVRCDSLDAAAAEAARRVIGPYPVSDIETLDPELRVAAVRSILAAARYLLLDAGARRGETAAILRPAWATCSADRGQPARRAAPSSQSSASVRQRACSVSVPHT